jgi:lysophospholipase L1-like esterase
MKQILVYSDSLTWGIVPNTRKRLDFFDRWPGVLEQTLNKTSQTYRVIENCLNGRRTAWEDPYKPGRNGLVGIQQVLEMHAPLELVVLALGTNDFQSMHQHNAWHSAQGIRALVTEIREAPIEPGMPIAPILVVCPPEIETPKGSIAPKFAGGEHKCVGISGEFKSVADDLNCDFFDIGSVTGPSKVDGIHLDLEQHHLVGEKIAKKIGEILSSDAAKIAKKA